MALESVNFRYTFVGGRGTRPGFGQLTLIALRDAGASVAANVVKSYRTADGVKLDHGVDSDAYAAAQVVVQNLQDKFRIGTYANASAIDVADRTFGTGSAISSGTLPASVAPIQSVASVTNDGVAYTTIVYTTKTPNVGNFPGIAATTLVLNPVTRAFYSGASTSGAGAGIVFGTINTPNLTPLKAQILTQPVEVVTFAGLRYSAQSHGMWADLVAWADVNNLMVYAAMDDSVVAPAAGSDSDLLIRAIRADNFQLLAAKTIDPVIDLTSAYAAVQASSPANGTLKGQAAPKGISYLTTLPYTRDEHGDSVDPSIGTFHESGANTITFDGTFIFSDDRAATDYSTATDVLFGGVRRTLNATNALVDANASEALLSTGDATPIFDEIGLNTMVLAAKNGLNEAVSRRFIRDDYDLRPPALEDTLEADRKKRLFTGTAYDMTVTTAMQVVDFTVSIGQ